ncbi:MAG: hypothetical protein L3J95_03825 [Thermoplasmata archaeon]|nr:hypothetical protein [Thermoplasmata archaeon]MCI4359536.1 hypothetical protein [Thermoplasmata archaeon]
MLRAARPSDSPAVSSLLSRTLAAGPAGADWNSERLNALIRGLLSRWGLRAAFWVASRLGRPTPRVFVEEVNGTIGGAIVWTPGREAAWIAVLGIDPDQDGSGIRDRLIERCWEETRRTGLSTLIVPGSVLSEAPDLRSEMTTVGFGLIGVSQWWRFELAPTPDGLANEARVRPYRGSDAAALVPFARQARGPRLEAVHPVRRSGLEVSPTVARALGSSTKALVHDGPAGPDAFVRATFSRATESAHLHIVLDPAVCERSGGIVLGAALAWCWSQGAKRVVTETFDPLGAPAAQLRRTGFVEAERWDLWARAVDGPT